MRPHLPTYLFVLPWALHHAGGVNQVVIDLGLEIQKLGVFRPLVLITDWHAKKPVWEEVHGLETVRWRVYPYPSNSAEIKERIAYQLWKWKFRSKFRDFCDDQEISVINSHYPTPSSGITIGHLIKETQTPVSFLLSFHGSDINSSRNADAMMKAEWRHLLQFADGVVSCSDDLGRKIRETFGQDIITHTIHNGVNYDFMMSSVAMSPSSISSPREKIILSIGKFNPIKGQDVLIEAFSFISSDYPDINLVLIGVPDNALPNLKNLCLTKDCADRITFHQNVPHDQIASYIKQATVFVLPSRREAFPLAILEAGVFGIPVIASDVGGIPEIINNGHTGLLVPPDNPEELGKSLRFVLDTPGEAEKMGNALCNLIKTKFTWSSVAKKYQEIISTSNTSDAPRFQ